MKFSIKRKKHHYWSYKVWRVWVARKGRYSVNVADKNLIKALWRTFKSVWRMER